MPRGIFDLSTRGWGRVVLWTVIGTLACIAIVLYVDSFNFMNMAKPERDRAILFDFLLPIGLGVPAFLFFTMKLRELAIAHHELARHASTDGLTAVLNRSAFTTLVEAYLADTRRLEKETHGALLVVDADHFKSINDSYGHDKGDEALRIIAGAIKGMLRNVDLVGRIGGEEFGVFLPGAAPDQAATVAERIRVSVTSAEFAPDGKRYDLSVSVGGAAFARRLPFGDIFRIADQQLYLAKQRGRNRTSVAPVIHYETVPMAAA